MLSRLIPLQDKVAWETALQGLPHGVCHTHEYNHAMHLSHPEPVYLYVATDSATFRTVCPLKVRHKKGALDITTPYGLSGFTGQGTCDHFFKHWTDFCQDQNWVCAYIMQHPRFPSPLPAESFGPHFVFLDPQQDLFQQFHPTLRHDLRQLLKKPLTVKTPSIAAFHTLSQLTRHRTGASDLYDFSQETIQNLSHDKGLLLGVYEEDTLLGASLFLENQGYVDYFAHASLSQFRESSKILLWKAIQHYQQAILINLGGGADPQDGLTAFKKRFGGQVVPIPVGQYIFQHQVYHRLCTGSEEITANYFPSYYQGP